MYECVCVCVFVFVCVCVCVCPLQTIVIANLVPVDLTPIVVSNNLGSALAPLVGALNTQFASVRSYACRHTRTVYVHAG